MHLMKILLFLVAVVLLTSCGDAEKEKVYPPLSEFMYCDDAFLDRYAGIEKFTFAKQFTDFVQYPDDWTKFGLKGKVKRMSCERQRGILTEVLFDIEGHLISQGSTFGRGGRYGSTLDFEYADGRLARVVHRTSREAQTYEYDDQGKLNLSKGDRYEKRFEYHANGMLKSITMSTPNDYSPSLKDGIYSMNCDETGRVLSLTMRAAHPVIDILGIGTFEFEYDDRGLCNVKHGRIFVDNDYHQICDTVFSTSRFTYNEHNDLVKWEEEYHTGKGDKSGSFVKQYSYVYDEEGNWTTRSTLDEAGETEGTFTRNIEYFSIAEIAAFEQAQEAEKRLKEELKDGPFKGVWAYSEPPEEEDGRMFGGYDMVLVLDFYGKSVTDGTSDEKTAGGFDVSTVWNTSSCKILSFRPDGNKAEITYEDLGIYSATLIYHPDTKQMEMIDGKLIKADEEVPDVVRNESHIIRERTLLEFKTREVVRHDQERKTQVAESSSEEEVEIQKTPLTSRSLFQLAGPVKEVTITQKSGKENTMKDMYCYQDGTIKAMFDPTGALTRIAYSGGPVEFRFVAENGRYACEVKDTSWLYPAYLKYEPQGNRFRIRACLNQKDGTKGSEEVTVFEASSDEKDRISISSDMFAGELMGYAGGNQINSTYRYQGDSHLPSSILTEMIYGGDTYIIEFQPLYEQTDKYGNWLKAKFINEGKEMYVQEREISYY